MAGYAVRCEQSWLWRAIWWAIACRLIRPCCVRQSGVTPWQAATALLAAAAAAAAATADGDRSDATLDACPSLRSSTVTATSMTTDDDDDDWDDWEDDDDDDDDDDGLSDEQTASVSMGSQPRVPLNVT